VVWLYDLRKPLIESKLDHEMVNSGQFYDMEGRRIEGVQKEIREIRICEFDNQPNMVYILSGAVITLPSTGHD
jgi:hypothetical protein